MLKKRIFTELLLLAAIALAAQDSPLVIRFVRHGQPGVKGTDFTPAFILAKKMIARGDIGELFMAEAVKQKYDSICRCGSSTNGK